MNWKAECGKIEDAIANGTMGAALVFTKMRTMLASQSEPGTVAHEVQKPNKPCALAERQRQISAEGDTWYIGFKGHDIMLQRDGNDKNWYIRVRGADGLYKYDGYWRDSVGKSAKEALHEAKVGAMLIRPAAGAPPIDGGQANG